MQRDSAVRVGAASAIFEVPFDGATYGGELAADLMMASGQQFDLYQPIAFGLFQGFVA